MSIVNQKLIPLKLKLKTGFINLIYCPNIYVALVIGSLIGGLFGSAIGLFSGAYIGMEYNLCAECPSKILGYSIQGINLNALAGAYSGSAIGALLLANASWIVTAYQTYQNSKLSKILSRDNIQHLIKFCFMISLEVNLGVLIGAVIASLFYPGMGTIVGGTTGFFIMLLITTLQLKILLQNEK